MQEKPNQNLAGNSEKGIFLDSVGVQLVFPTSVSEFSFAARFVDSPIQRKPLQTIRTTASFVSAAKESAQPAGKHKATCEMQW